MSHTPGPWHVKWAELCHRKGSPVCKETCGRGEVPLRVEALEPWEGWPETEGHVFRLDYVDDIVAENGDHVVCTGHDYDEGGLISSTDACLIAAAPDLLAACKAFMEAPSQPKRHEAERNAIAMMRAAIAKAEGLE